MAGLTTTQTFSDGDTVTAAKLNNIIANASISDGGIAPDKLAPNSVKEANMANNSVDTNALVSDSVTNSKLDTMEKRRVKVNATDATANPTDLFVDANELLVGTSSTINAVSFSDDLALDNAGATASKIIAAPSLINGKSTVAASNLDELLIYDQDATTVLKKTTAGSIVASLKATDSQSGSAELATSAELIGGTASPTNLVAGNVNAAPMMAKAWGYLKTASDAIVTASSILQNCSVTRTNDGAFTVAFTTALPSVKYMVLGNGRTAGPTGYGNGLQLVSSSLSTSGFTFITIDTNGDVGSLVDPDGGMQFVVYGLTS